MPLNPLKELQETQALLTGHFKLSSGRHSSHYLQCAKALQYPPRAETLGRALADRLRDKGPFHVVASPAVGGVVIGTEVARALGVRSVFAERGAQGRLEFRRGFSLSPGERVVIVDDVLTTGLSFREMVELVRSVGAEPVALACVAERGEHPRDFGIPVFALVELKVRDTSAEECPACRQGLPLDKPGTRPEPAS